MVISPQASLNWFEDFFYQYEMRIKEYSLDDAGFAVIDFNIKRDCAAYFLYGRILFNIMCLATPSKVIKMEGDWVEVSSRDHTHRANISLLKNKNVSLGDYLLIHGDMAIQKLDNAEAKKILCMIDENEELFEKHE